MKTLPNNTAHKEANPLENFMRSKKSATGFNKTARNPEKIMGIIKVPAKYNARVMMVIITND
jgi:hypothetical protein